jgi:hypothetical protein
MRYGWLLSSSCLCVSSWYGDVETKDINHALPLSPNSPVPQRGVCTVARVWEILPRMVQYPHQMGPTVLIMSRKSSLFPRSSSHHFVAIGAE